MPAKKKRASLVTSDVQDELLAHTYTLEQLIAGTIERSRAHVGELQRRYGPELLRRVQRTDDTASADGILSDVFMRLPDALSRYEHRERFEAFLWTIAERVLIDHQRKRSRQARKVLAENIVVPRNLSPRRELEHNDIIERLAAVLAPRPREVWTRHMAGATNAQTAEALGMTPTAVAAMLSRAWDLVRERAAQLALRPSDIINSGLSEEILPWPKPSPRQR